MLIVLVSTGWPDQSSLENIKCKGSQMNITLNVGSKEDLIGKNIPSGNFVFDDEDGGWWKLPKDIFIHLSAVFSEDLNLWI